MAGERQIKPVDAELALRPIETFLPCSQARRVVEGIVEEEQMAKPCIGTLVAQPCPRALDGLRSGRATSAIAPGRAGRASGRLQQARRPPSASRRSPARSSVY